MIDHDINEKIAGLLDTSLQKFLVKNYNDAIRDLKAAEVLDKNNPEILNNLGVNYAKLGLYKTSVKYFERLLDLSSTFVGVLTVKKMLAYALIRNGQLGKAVEYLNDVIKLAPDDIPAYNMRGYCQERLKNYFEAVKNYRKVTEMDRNNITALNSLAYIYAHTGGDLETALLYARKACASNNSNAAYLDTLGYVCLKQKKFDQAREHFSRALKISPFSEDIRGHIRELDVLKPQK